MLPTLLNAAEETTELGALLATELMGKTSDSHSFTMIRLLAILEGDAHFHHRVEASRVLAQVGDPRDLQALVTIPSGIATMGSASISESLPIHQLCIAKFQMGVFPVVNKDYKKFVNATNRHWHSPDGSHVARVNVPATHVTWHDAVAYCNWLTEEWRKDGKISTKEIVRLPREPEWEYSARGRQDEFEATFAKLKEQGAFDNGDFSLLPWSDDLIFPWGVEPSKSYGQAFLEGTKKLKLGQEEAVYNICELDKPVAVGITPRNVSPFGVFDMAGNVGEWCSTAWGPGSKESSFRYPYVEDDGREIMNKESGMLRVIRGGCFKSARCHISATHRVGAQPDKLWRNVGFRIVVAPTV